MLFLEDMLALASSSTPPARAVKHNRRRSTVPGIACLAAGRPAAGPAGGHAAAATGAGTGALRRRCAVLKGQSPHTECPPHPLHQDKGIGDLMMQLELLNNSSEQTCSAGSAHLTRKQQVRRRQHASGTQAAAVRRGGGRYSGSRRCLLEQILALIARLEPWKGSQPLGEQRSGTAENWQLARRSTERPAGTDRVGNRHISGLKGRELGCRLMAAAAAAATGTAGRGSAQRGSRSLPHAFRVMR